ncbi:hypothetical protein LXA43DRAFT_929429 [Ganoderma leucocontextum]|nr:hypothetical protein LXA43DRAFT_929429 [Ganoderma leucocontextum]
MDNQTVNESLADNFPAEVWLDIFDQIPNSTDLYGIAATCNKFWDLTMRARHRDIVWRTPEHVAQDLPVWNEFPNMEPSVGSLTISVNKAYRGSFGRVVDLDKSISRAGFSRETLLRFDRMYASPLLHEMMLAKINQFTNLASLTFADMSVQDAHFSLIHSLPRLRTLKIERCAVETRMVEPMKHKQLPITDLTMLSVRRSRVPDRDIDGHLEHFVAGESISYALALCTAQGLRSLTIDASADIFRAVFNSLDAQARGWTIPIHLEHIYVVQKRSSGVGEKTPAFFGGEGTFPDAHLYHFCVQTTSLKTISTPIFVPTQITIAPEALPADLERFAAPVETAQLVAAVRKLQALGLMKFGVGAREGITALTSIGKRRRDLKMLLLDCKGWDVEIISAVAKLFKQLRRLRIVYDGPGPTEDFLVALAPDYLVKLPELHTLELYEMPRNGGYVPDQPKHLFDDSFESIEEELQNLVIPWNRYCPNLRKVQLHAGCAMTRGFEGGPWTLERVRRLPVKEDLDF